MTIEELYRWALKNRVEDLEVVVKAKNRNSVLNVNSDNIQCVHHDGGNDYYRTCEVAAATHVVI